MNGSHSKMLVVDDFVTMARIMKGLAEKAGFQHVDMCHDGESALEALRAGNHGFVLCDVEMQPMSGIEFARRVRAEPNGSRCVILLTTASRERVVKLVRDGADLLVDGIILKPFRAEDLKTKLSEIAERMRGRPQSLD